MPEYPLSNKLGFSIRSHCLIKHHSQQGVLVNLIKIRYSCCIFLRFPAPSRPRNIQVMAITDTTIQISWWEPARANGVLQGYRIYMLHQNLTSVETVRSNKSSVVQTLSRLCKYSNNFSILNRMADWKYRVSRFVLRFFETWNKWNFQTFSTCSNSKIIKI